ncbi:hypothetical protein SEA_WILLIAMBOONE_163 [Gordonia phage WilliamBoone]|nr:hypothetical protein SEA_WILLIAMBOONE_163 [Gordonia phage WilliamBoone]
MSEGEVMAHTFTTDEVMEMVNTAIDEIDVAAGLPEQGVIDALNLVANAVLWQTKNPGADLDLARVAKDCYDGNGIDNIVSWIYA